jgi:hypothetical protein
MSGSGKAEGDGRGALGSRGRLRRRWTFSDRKGDEGERRGDGSCGADGSGPVDLARER